MKREIVLIFGMALLLPSLRAQQHSVGLGAHGGGVLQVKADGGLSVGIGPQGGLDVYYELGSSRRVLSRRTGLYIIRPWGVRVGVQAGYSMHALSGSSNDRFTRTDYLGNMMDYRTAADYRMTVQSLDVGLPIMATWRNNGLMAAVGLRPQVTVPLRARQTLDNPLIAAYYEDYGVTVTNELITGLVPEAQLNRTEERKSAFGLYVGGELGREWRLSREWSVEGAFYLYLRAWNSSREDPLPDGTPLIDVSPIDSPGNPPARVTVNSASALHGRSPHPLEAGLRIALRRKF